MGEEELCRCGEDELADSQTARAWGRRSSPRQEISPEKQTSYQCQCSFLEGLPNRKVGTTSMNLKSSRSHIIFTCVIEAWSKGCSSNGFSSSQTSRITFVDIVGPDNDELDGGSKHCTRE
ncbi:hypothetical protein OsI_36599 [Oryza sativa Indica Group]|uniref:Kinesin motor domain-containing protein n=1 Tax=Oryza sativa subsp. indica TaxID=39946 RepID=B8BL87_ORYSI|nr:hypothetical protein OsI_36599 [Oryza sativa Indica Group]